MNEYNIIEPKASIEELDNEMNEWLQLPTKFKFRSNDECYRIHGCDVPTYYNKLRLLLMNTEDQANAFIDNKFNSNIVKEQMYDNLDSDTYNDKCTKTDLLMTNPYIVILKPFEDFDNAVQIYNNYLSLASKNRRLSDYYSFDIWGVNVRNMYEYIKNKYQTIESEKDIDSTSNIIASESTSYAIYDRWNKAISEHNNADIEKYKTVIEEYLSEEVDHNNDNYIIIAELCNIKENTIGHDEWKLFLPRYCPWFTIDEMNNLGIEYPKRIPNYRKVLIETFDKYQENRTDELHQEILALGWNPHIRPNAEAFDYAKDRQEKFFRSKEDIANQALGIELPYIFNFNNDSLSFTIDRDIFKPWFDDKGEFVGISKSDKEDYNPNDPNYYKGKINIDNDKLNILRKKCRSSECIDKSYGKGYTNGLDYCVLDPVNRWDTDTNMIKDYCVQDLIERIIKL